MVVREDDSPVSLGCVARSRPELRVGARRSDWQANRIPWGVGRNARGQPRRTLVHPAIALSDALHHQDRFRWSLRTCARANRSSREALAMVWQRVCSFDGVGLETPNRRCVPSRPRREGRLMITRWSDVMCWSGAFLESPPAVGEGHVMNTNALFKASSRRYFLKSAAAAFLALGLGIVPAAFP